jgi:hypothetical protein
MDGEQGEQLERVRLKIEYAIHSFVDQLRLKGACEFNMSELTSHVMGLVPNTAPDSPSRILRLMRTERKLLYEVVDRSKSRYKLFLETGDLFPGHNG